MTTKLEETCCETAKQLGNLAHQLASRTRSGHADYISKKDAAYWAVGLATALRAASAKADALGRTNDELHEELPS